MRVVFLFSGLLIPGAAGALERVDPRPDGVRLVLEPPAPTVEATASGVLVRIDGHEVVERVPGAPDLPSRHLLVAIPRGASPSLTVLASESRFVPTPVPPRPVARIDAVVREPDDLARGGDGDPVDREVLRSPIFLRDPAAYAASADRAVAEIVRSGALRDQHFVEIRVRPVRYDALRGGLEVVTRLTLDLAFGSADAGATAVAPEPDPFEGIYREAFVNYGQGRSFRAGSTASDSPPLAAAALDPNQPVHKIRVREAGPVRVTAASLTGAPILSEPISDWKVLSRGAEVPIQVQDDGDDLLEPGEWIQFWGRPLDEEPKTVLNTDIGGAIDLYEYRDVWDEAIYFLTVDPAAPRSRMAEVDAAPTFTRVPPASFVDSVREEVDDAWRPLGAADPWYWLPTLTEGGATPSRTIDVPMPGLASTTADVTVRANLRGVSEDTTVAPDHATRVELRNGSNQVLATDDASFDGRTLYTHVFAWTWPGSGAQLSDPARVRIEARPAPVAGHQVIVDWVEIDYERTFAAIGDRLVFEWTDEDAEFAVTGLSGADVEVWELTGSVDGTAVADASRLTGGNVSGAGPFEVRFRIDDDPGLPPGSTRRFAVFAGNAANVPAGGDLVEDTVSDLRDNANQADLLVVAHPDVLDDPANCASAALTDLLNVRASRGLTSRVACIEDVQDEFNDGHPGPQAIRNFLSYVFSNEPGEGWGDPRPAYLLLLGDGSYETRSGTAGGDYVPTQILFKDDPSIGYYASDNVLAAVVGDDQLADLVVGRLSARSVQQADVQLQKILDYEQTPATGSWTGRALFVSDRSKDPIGDPDEAIRFEEINQIGIDAMKVPPHTFANLRYATDYGGVNPAAIRQDIKDEINGISGPGVSIMQYIGHGNFQLWSDDVIFCGDESSPFCPIDDTQDLVNGLRLPWVLVHNCLTGGFHTPAAKSMGESWVRRSGGGAVALYAPSGLGFRYLGEVVTEEIWTDLFGPKKERTVGVPVMNSQVRLCGQDSIEGCQYYVLLGDPSMTLQIPSVGPPTDPVATGGNGQVELQWTASVDPGVTYDVYRTTQLNVAYGKVNAAPITDPGGAGPVTYVDTTAENARTYYYYVVALDAQGFESRWSNFNSDCDVSGPDCLRATPLNPNPPAPPTGLIVTDAESGGRLDLTWNASPEDDVNRYYVHYGTESGVYTETRDAGRDPMYSITGLTDGQTYYVVVTATNTSGNESGFSDEGVGTPSFVRGLKSPAFITSLRVDKSGQDAVLSWDAVVEDIYGKAETVDHYEVFRGTTPDFLPGEANRISPPGGVASTSFTDVGALSSATPRYHYLVRAVDLDGNVGGLGRQLPDGVGDLVVAKSTTTPGDIVLSWTAVTTVVNGVDPTTIDRYEVYAASTPFSREDVRDGAVPLLTTVTAPSLTITPAAGDRFYSVVAVDPKGNRSPF